MVRQSTRRYTSEDVGCSARTLVYHVTTSLLYDEVYWEVMFCTSLLMHVLQPLIASYNPILYVLGPY